MEQYIVVTLTDSADKKSVKYKILKSADAIPAGYAKVFGPEGIDDCAQWLGDRQDDSGKWFWLTMLQYILIFLVTLTFVIVICFGAYQLGTAKSEATSAEETARTFITFLVAVGTIGLALLATLTAMIIRDFKERFALAKDVLTLLIGILGTIVGFYFGSAKQNPSAGDANTNVNANSRANTNSNSNSNANSGKSNSNAANSNSPSNGAANNANRSNANGIGFHDPSENGMEALPVRDNSGGWKIEVRKL